MNPRSLFRPKHPQLKEQCASCPFRKGNDAEFEAVIKRLDSRLTGKKLQRAAAVARTRIHTEAKSAGEFACHHTAYDAEMNLRPEHERRQCPGATAAFVQEGEHLHMLLLGPPDYDADEKRFKISETLLASEPWMFVEKLLRIDLTVQEPGELTRSQLRWLANASYDLLRPHAVPIYRMLKGLGLQAYVPLDNAERAKRETRG